MYWYLGSEILTRQATEGSGSGRSGTRVIPRLSSDLQAAFPGMGGLSVRNLEYMRKFAAAWPDFEMAQHVAALLPWGHNILLLDKLNDPAELAWYAEQAAENGWTRKLLEHHITTGLHAAQGAAITNFAERMPEIEARAAQQITRDPLMLDFVQVAPDSSERDFNLDLLFYHHPTRRWIVIELKLGRFEPEYVGKLNFYVKAVDQQLAGTDDRATIGMLLCASRDEAVVRVTLRGIESPLAVVRYRTRGPGSMSTVRLGQRYLPGCALNSRRCATMRSASRPGPPAASPASSAPILTLTPADRKSAPGQLAYPRRGSPTRVFRLRFCLPGWGVSAGLGAPGRRSAPWGPASARVNAAACSSAGLA